MDRGVSPEEKVQVLALHNAVRSELAREMGAFNESYKQLGLSPVGGAAKNMARKVVILYVNFYFKKLSFLPTSYF